MAFFIVMQLLIENPISEQIRRPCVKLIISTENKISNEPRLRKPAFCICENKDADQLQGNREANQRLCFRYIDSTILLLSKYEISSL